MCMGAAQKEGALALPLLAVLSLLPSRLPALSVVREPELWRLSSACAAACAAACFAMALVPGAAATRRTLFGLPRRCHSSASALRTRATSAS